MRNNLQTIYNHMTAMKNKNTAQISMMNMLKELTEHSFKGYANAEDRMIVFDYSEKQFNGRVEFEFLQGRECMLAKMIFPVKCCSETRWQMAQLLHMINCSTLLGVFEMDPRDGGCMFKYVHYYGDNAMTQNQAARAVGILLSSVHHYAETIMPLLTGRAVEEGKACREYGLIPKGEAPKAGTAQLPAPAQSNGSTRTEEPARSDSSTPNSPLRFSVDNDEVAQLFHAAYAQRPTRNEAGKGEGVQPTQGSEAEEERDKGGIPVQPEVSEDGALEPGQMAIAFNDSGEMVGLVTGASLGEDEGDSEGEQTEQPPILIDPEDVQDVSDEEDNEEDNEEE